MATHTIAHPVRTLRELVTRLEAAITLTLAKPTAKSVHNLRTTIRRIEAQLELLSLLPNLPRHAKREKTACKLLAKLRRAAGRVRDLDAQRDLIESKSQEAYHLRSFLKHQRSKEADRLLDATYKYQPKLIRSLEDLLKAFSPAESLPISPSRIAELSLHWYTHNVPVTTETPDQLHSIRKSAKLARYMAESATESAKPPLKLARTFESLQQSGGHWHDWLTLFNIADRELGTSSPLVRSFERNCENSLAAYRRHLKSLPKSLTL
jgi:CHAD domain-containing protein